MKYTIKHRYTNTVLFAGDYPSLAACVAAAVEAKINLRGADLQDANLLGTNLQGAKLRGADLRGAHLLGAYLQYANLQGADLRNANLRDANLRGANLQYANLQYANLRGANLQYANLQYANLQDANLQRAYHSELMIAQTRILPEGSLIGWKKCNDNILVKLLIPETARRSHAFGRKCRAEYAQVLEIIGSSEGRSNPPVPGKTLVYRVGEIVRPDKWDDNFQNECSSGIHFFITRIEAENYV